MTSQRRGLSEHIILILMIIGLLAFAIDRVLFFFQRGLFPASSGRRMSDARPPNIVEFRERHEAVRRPHRHPRRDLSPCRTCPARASSSTILGPSGCGKSTVLRLIAGLPPHHPATEGTVLVGGNAPVSRPGSDRGMVFQDYTSFDNRTVEDNVAFGLECRGVGARERREQARAMDREGRARREARRAQVSEPSCRAACASAWRSRAR